MNFSDFALRKEIISALKSMNYETPTDVQAAVIPHALEGKHLRVQSLTGSGKTGAFVIPALNAIDSRIRKPQVLILAPTRELALQTREEVFSVSKNMRMGSLAVFGGSPIRKQIRALETGPQVIIATPGRLLDMMDRKVIDLSAVSMFILDEVDQMMDMGFAPSVKEIWQKLPALNQVMAFSATFTDKITRMLENQLDGEYTPLILSKAPTVDSINHVIMKVAGIDKYRTLKAILERSPNDKVIVFTARRHETEELERYLYRDGFNASFIHGDMQQRDRIRALKNFKEGRVRIFVGTDVASRGLNLNNIDLVINYHVPNDPESYIHRIGRTGRAGASGKAIMLVSSQEERDLFRIERMHKIEIDQVDYDENPMERTISTRPPRGNGGGNRRGGYRGRGGRNSGGYR